MARIRITLVITLALVASGCTTLSNLDWTGHEASFEDDYKLYTRLVRWGEFERASRFVEPEQQEAYRDGIRDLGVLHFTDYEADKPKYDRLTETATVYVRYSAYRPATLETVSFTEEQRWKRDLETGDWRLEHEGPPLVAAKSVGAR